MYSDERMDDILKSKQPIELENGIFMNDIIRMFKGDDPASQLEVGQQKGGNHFCWACPIQSSRVYDMIHSFNLPYSSIENRVEKVKFSLASQERLVSGGKVKLYSNLAKPDIVSELHESIKFRCTQPTKELQEILVKEMAGIQRLPALMFTSPFKTLNDLSLSKYEVLKFEPLHDISNHIKNLYES